MYWEVLSTYRYILNLHSLHRIETTVSLLLIEKNCTYIPLARVKPKLPELVIWGKWLCLIPVTTSVAHVSGLSLYNLASRIMVHNTSLL